MFLWRLGGQFWPTANSPAGGLTGGPAAGPAAGTSSADQNSPASPASSGSPAVNLSPAQTAEVRSQEDVRRLGIIFAEKLGSYSNQSQLANMTDLYPIMTDAMKAWADKYVAGLKKDFESAKDYQGITTRVLTSSFKSFDPGTGAAASAAGSAKAEVLLATQREKSVKPGQTQVYYQNLTIQFIKDAADNWKVDGAYWEKK